jgi:hypothetical protein
MSEYQSLCGTSVSVSMMWSCAAGFVTIWAAIGVEIFQNECSVIWRWSWGAISGEGGGASMSVPMSSILTSGHGDGGAVGNCGFLCASKSLFRVFPIQSTQVDPKSGKHTMNRFLIRSIISPPFSRPPRILPLKLFEPSCKFRSIDIHIRQHKALVRKRVRGSKCKYRLRKREVVICVRRL